MRQPRSWEPTKRENDAATVAALGRFVAMIAPGSTVERDGAKVTVAVPGDRLEYVRLVLSSSHPWATVKSVGSGS